MSAAHASAGGVAVLHAGLERLRLALLWALAFAGAFVFVEPGPYEVMAVVTIAAFAVTGLAMPRALAPLVAMLSVYCLGYTAAVLRVIDDPHALVWVLVSWYLSVTAVFFACALAQNTAARLDRLVRGWVAAAFVASLVGILGYFHLLGPLSEVMLRYGRVRATFNDPNVLGAFLVFPALILLQRIMTGASRGLVRAALMLGVIGVALILSYSRGAWGQFVLAAVSMMILTFVIGASNVVRVRVLATAIVGLAFMAACIAVLLSVDQVAELLTSRATLTQSYDVSPLGRFGRYSLGLALVLEAPFGLGPLQFAKTFVEDPHNTFLNAFVTGGWIVGLVYPALVLVTIVTGARHVAVATPWRPTYLAVYCAFLGTVAESAIVDIDHWRHFFLLTGAVWGLVIAGQRYAGSPACPAAPPAGHGIGRPMGHVAPAAA